MFMVLAFIKWWYGPGIPLVARNVVIWPRNIERTFSVPLLLHTLFAPWKRIVSSGGRSLDAKFRAEVDNLVSRFVGFTVRSVVLLAAMVCMVAAGLGAVIVLVMWPLLPVAAIYCLTRSIIG